jgi:hypothetical protein
MTWRELLAQGRVVKESTDRKEIETLWKVANRNLSDSHAKSISNDARYSHAYDAARALAIIVVKASGYRVKVEGGGHYNTFRALQAVSAEFVDIAQYFDACRRNGTIFFRRKQTLSPIQKQRS